MLIFDLDQSSLSPVSSWLTSRGFQALGTNPVVETGAPQPKGVERMPGPLPPQGVRPGSPWTANSVEERQRQMQRDAEEFSRKYLGTGTGTRSDQVAALYGREDLEAARQLHQQEQERIQARRIREATLMKRRLDQQREQARLAAEVRYAQAQARSAAQAQAVQRAMESQRGQRLQSARGETLGGYLAYNPQTGKYEPGKVQYDQEAGDTRLTPDWANVGNLTSQSRVPTGDFQASPWTTSGGRNEFGPVAQTYRTVNPTLAAPIYKPGDQVALPMQRNWSRDRIRQIQEKMAIAGVLPGDYASSRGTWGRGEIMGAQAVMEYANLHGWTFEKALDQLSSDSASRQQAGLSGADNGPGAGFGAPLTVSSVDYSISSLDQAKQALSAIMAQQIGRAPTDAEVKRFLGQLNAAERKAPIKTISTRNASGSWSTTTRTDRTVDPTVEAERYVGAKNKDEVQDYGEVQYFDILNGLIGG